MPHEHMPPPTPAELTVFEDGHIEIDLPEEEFVYLNNAAKGIYGMNLVQFAHHDEDETYKFIAFTIRECTYKREAAECLGSLLAQRDDETKYVSVAVRPSSYDHEILDFEETRRIRILDLFISRSSFGT